MTLHGAVVLLIIAVDDENKIQGDYRGDYTRGARCTAG